MTESYLYGGAQSAQIGQVYYKPNFIPYQPPPYPSYATEQTTGISVIYNLKT
ncbi:hypothetical protein [Solimicrobium silvestre]|uniref:Uncharacterized protein n=1 Tax=Solimicrobium silvestre TaxID=2099400 RepID=A0A2S9GUP8_9BURK|nr:hypothetical protein [Solimicrobium silvestre]PRC91431.1 hypothetical protein S2091_3846 [Solimicrobium silvestre]